MKKNKICLSIALCSSLIYADDASYDLGIINVVTIATSKDTLKIVTDPRNPIQPIPASDGADYLKNIPGFSVKRKGGTDGDPVLRGMSGSKVGILVDGQEIYGGCGGRMDPPTSYIFPEAYDQVIVTKGPQTVLNGSGFSAGTVEFTKKPKYYPQADYDLYSSFKQGSFGRSDQFLDISGGASQGYGQIIITRSHSDDYKDGNGDTVRSEYTRSNASMALGYTPNEDTVIELSASTGKGEAKYADRTMDASKLDRENVGLKFTQYDVSSNIDKLEIQAYHNYVDHIMDNYTFRTTASYSAMNPDRTTDGGKIKISTTIPNTKITNISGIDYKTDKHTNRNAMGKASAALVESTLFSTTRSADFDFKQIGFFDETTFNLTEQDKIIAGIRVDKHEVLDKREKLGILIFNNPNYNKKDTATLTSGFVRYENSLPSSGFKYYIGLGHSERFADYWERTKYNLETITALNKTNPNAISYQAIPKPEKTNQLDIGANWNNKKFAISVSSFYSKINDYIQNRWLKEDGTAYSVPYNYGMFASTTSYTQVSNIDATVYGGEMDLSYKLTQTYKIVSALSYTHGQNDTEDKPLAQQPPLELKLSVMYDDNKYSAGLLGRFVAKQDRYDIGNGSIVMNGVDKGETPGFSIFSVNGGYKYNKYTSFSAGVDNIFNKTYAEHLSNADVSSASTFLTQDRIYEPGRNLWVELKIKL
ncbi:MAG: TonB-dependent copper receptor [Sulfurimonas sp.]|nr:TonB-dependent copper receptor [Sulfurimonas sp.]